MDKSKIFKIVPFSILLLCVTEKKVWAEETNSHEDDDEANEDDGSDFEPMSELPDAQRICPNLNRALNLATNKYKVREVKIYDPLFKNFKIGIEGASLCKDLWYVIAQRKSKNRDYNFDFHGRIGMVWKYNFYLGGDFGFSTGKDCVWEGDDKNKKEQNEKFDKKYSHLSSGFYVNAIVGYNYVYDKKNDVVFAAKLGFVKTIIEKLKNQTYSSGEKTEMQPCWIGLLIAVENSPFDFPLFWGFDLQINYLLNKKDIPDLENYFIPDYGHSSYRLNFGFNLFLEFKFDLQQEMIIP